MSCAPPLLSSNHFSVLSIHDVPDSVESSVSDEDAQPVPKLKPSPLCRPKWERWLSSKLIIRSLEEGPNSIRIPVHLRTTDTLEEVNTNVLVDCGATGDFIDEGFVERSKIPTQKLSQPIPVYNVDGLPNEAGSITKVTDMIMTYKGHSEWILLAVTQLGKQDTILGMTWLKKHNPEIDFTTGSVKLTCCSPRCCTCCRDEAREEHCASKAQARVINTCRTGPLPAFVEDTDDEDDDDQVPELKGFVEYEYEEGDRVWAASIPPAPEYICATASVSQQLAEAFQKNSSPWDYEKHIPEHLHGFNNVFSKDSFDELPESKPWDHAIELIPEANASKGCKVYPLSVTEQKELDAFLKENLDSSRICPSKSPMASPVFFVKKKCGGLRLVQDYRPLNTMTVKNKYPLLLIPELIAKLQGAKYFTKLDVHWGFNNVQIKEGDEWKAAFQTNRGLFEPLVIYFGLTNSPATFQTMMDDIFEELISEGNVVVYLDDILIFTKTLEEHWAIEQQVLELMRKQKLYLKPEKCKFEKTTIEYLGVVISENRVSMDLVKIAGVQEWPAPTNKKKVQSFLGFTNFYHQFIKDFSNHTRLLFDLTCNAPLDATLIHESGYCSHKPDVSTLGSAHHPKAVRIRVLPWCRAWLGSLIGSVWVSGHGGWSAEDAGWEGRGV